MPYEKKIEKRKLIDKGNYLLKSSCCDENSCELLLNDIQETKNKCNDLFSSLHKDNLDEKGNILTESLCSNLREKQIQIANSLQNFTKKAGKRKKRKNSKKLYKKYKYKAKTQKRSKKY